LSTSLGQKSVSVSEILSERRKARACSEGCNPRNYISIIIYVHISYKNTYACACRELHFGFALRAFAVFGGQAKDHITVECVWTFGEDKRFIGQLGAGLQQRERARGRERDREGESKRDIYFNYVFELFSLQRSLYFSYTLISFLFYNYFRYVLHSCRCRRLRRCHWHWRRCRRRRCRRRRS